MPLPIYFARVFPTQRDPGRADFGFGHSRLSFTWRDIGIGAQNAAQNNRDRDLTDLLIHSTRTANRKAMQASSAQFVATVGSEAGDLAEIEGIS